MHKNIVTILLSIAVFLGSTFVQADTSTETPEQGLIAIIDLYKKQEWGELVKKRCLDSKHAESEEALAKLADSLSAQFSDQGTLEALIGSFEAALKAGPRVESEGTVAIFASEAGSVRLSKMDNGTWGLRF